MVIHEYIRFAWMLFQFRRVQSQAFLHSTFVRELSVQLWSANQRTTEAEEVNHDQVSHAEEKTLVVSPVRNGGSLTESSFLICRNWL
jgi:hypothetical protein